MKEFCPCCGYRTLAARGQYDICAVCGWEDDGERDAYVQSLPNHCTLWEYQKAWASGAEPWKMSVIVGPKIDPLPDRDPNWKQLADPIGWKCTTVDDPDWDKVLDRRAFVGADPSAARAFADRIFEESFELACQNIVEGQKMCLVEAVL
jgi:hypothetical protein